MRNRITTIFIIGIFILIAAPQLYSQNDTDLMALTNKSEPDWGTTAEISTKISSVEFKTMTSSITSEFDGDGWTYVSSGFYPFLFAGLHFPSGARLNHFYVTVSDTSSTYDITAYLMICPSSSSSCVRYPSAGCKTTGAPGVTSLYCNLSTFNIVVNNYLNTYLAFIALGVANDTNKFKDYSVHYNLQVSPAPATATFSDVPTSHIFFQYIEALAASGITSGCASNLYCPDQPVTRGQMAKYLALALGLHWLY